MSTKYAIQRGDHNFSYRVSPFFDSIADAQCAHLKGVIVPYLNWEEHERWNAERVGNYAHFPVPESKPTRQLADSLQLIVSGSLWSDKTLIACLPYANDKQKGAIKHYLDGSHTHTDRFLLAELVCDIHVAYEEGK